ncbi:hypothetical protein PAXRUDRAFT_835145 [Paxillus rubicundulus Ve08.2h10]|uniref:Unplaced genomic scaffold scaffold_2371, whole genome shotgun sequence n=1 Tax=Paxillus rubicundulus Ve08.2h10 TaxID=930991 RepID=A0A0D0D998_9AGAM|nr:hypothetical protein PAXRUDRAFT_835145 [Paxillus rubicundulus Ve08.2h10]
MDLSLQSKPDVSKLNPSPQMWIRCVEGGPNELKIDPTSQKRTRHFSPARNGLETAHPHLKWFIPTCLRISKCPPSQF